MISLKRRSRIRSVHSQGNSSNIAELAATLVATSASPTAIVYEDLVNLYGSLDAAYVQNASWVMTSTTCAALMGLISTTGQPILQTDVAGNPFNAIFGRPIVISEFQQSIAATNAAILLGDLKEGYVLRQAGGFAIKRLVELYAATNETGWRASDAGRELARPAWIFIVGVRGKLPQ
jgi:HK97 family phage major capsid protein